mmetsp:Transcript_14172/g.2270  ORF Transcript_14172/g.2270 Transcript_14172/m.2270 type:complete len:87 (+) Transcript_14172:158-418(+)
MIREAYETTVFACIRLNDMPGLERAMHVLKSLYFNNQSSQNSNQKWPIFGLWLTYLLSFNRMADYNTELELVPYEERSNAYIDFAV